MKIGKILLILILILIFSCSTEDSLEESIKEKIAQNLLERSDGRETLDDRCSVTNKVNRTINCITYKRCEIVFGTSTDPNNSFEN